jgi:hypothetical protein
MAAYQRSRRPNLPAEKVAPDKRLGDHLDAPGPPPLHQPERADWVVLGQARCPDPQWADHSAQNLGRGLRWQALHG